MKGQKKTGKYVLVFVVLAALVTALALGKKIAARHSLASQIAALSPRGAPPRTVEDLRKAISLYGA
jgi:hypothetical protein